jgi:hypothetical protein
MNSVGDFIGQLLLRMMSTTTLPMDDEWNARQSGYLRLRMRGGLAPAQCR